MNARPTVLVDVDGTMADINHRRQYLELPKPDWKSFNSQMHLDKPNQAVVDLYKTLWESNKYELILVSGRQEEHRKITEDWLSNNEIPYSLLLMRQNKDYREDSLIKEELLNDLIIQGKTIAFAIDDRKQVVNMWRRNGITCLQCAEGNF